MKCLHSTYYLIERRRAERLKKRVQIQNQPTQKKTIESPRGFRLLPSPHSPSLSLSRVPTPTRPPPVCGLDPPLRPGLNPTAPGPVLHLASRPGSGNSARWWVA
jgi:hypothetical protein